MNLSKETHMDMMVDKYINPSERNKTKFKNY